MIKRNIGLWLFIGLFISPVVWAEARWYQVEVLVFEHKKNGLDSENWPQDTLSSSYYPNTDLKPAREINKLSLDDNFVELPRAEFNLQDAKRRVKRQGGYRVVMHKAWHQYIGDKDDAPYLNITGGKVFNQNEDPSQEIQGVIKLSLARYLHLETDLIFNKLIEQKQEAIQEQENSAIVSWFNPPQQKAEPTGPLMVLKPFRMKAKRKMRSKDVHYIDHPMFGMLIQITKDKKANPA